MGLSVNLSRSVSFALPAIKKLRHLAKVPGPGKNAKNPGHGQYTCMQTEGNTGQSTHFGKPRKPAKKTKEITLQHIKRYVLYIYIYNVAPC